MDRKNISSDFQWVVGFFINSFYMHVQGLLLPVSRQNCSFPAICLAHMYCIAQYDHTHGTLCFDATRNMRRVVVWRVVVYSSIQD